MLDKVLCSRVAGGHAGSQRDGQHHRSDLPHVPFLEITQRPERRFDADPVEV
jgi:hypothetical protein